MTDLTIALDWTPNINHIGFFVAKDEGFYSKLGLNVSLLNPATDNYEVTPAKKVELGEADFALCPTESVISYRTKERPFPMIAIAALLQEDLSAITVKSDSGIHSPKNLDGKVYSSYKARYEDGIVKEMIKNDGGQGSLEIVYPEKLGIWANLLEGSSDATWIFLNWEGVAAESAGVDLHHFKLSDYQIPYSYSPVIAANESMIADRKEAYHAFLQATKKGFLHCQNHPDEVVEILSNYVPEYDQHIDLSKALEMTAPHFGTEVDWGMLKEERIQAFVDWIKVKGLETSSTEISEIATNDCL